ncbi:hypothetical protein B566_EDAN007065 [Ephemera danica]|nr:hypothetical protein B566_EDAN007065 [Ephemera danica]
MGRCHRRTMHACVGRAVFRECYTEGTGQMIARAPEHACSILTGLDDSVCYGAARSREEICGPSPPPCRTPGNFSIPGRCQNFYTCHIERGAMQQTINECPPQYEFSPWFKKCVVTSTHGGCYSGGDGFLAITDDTVVGSLEISPALKLTPEENATSPPESPTTSPPESPTTSPEFTAIALTPTTPKYPVCFYPSTKLVDPESCHHFYVCSMFLTLSKQKCPFRMRYDDVNQDCKYFIPCRGRPHSDQ